MEFIIAASWESAPSQSVGRAHQAKRKTVCVSKSLIRCATLRVVNREILNTKNPSLSTGVLLYWEPGGVLLSHGNCHTTIAAAAFHF